MEDVTIWPQVTYIALIAFGFAVTLFKHGEQTKVRLEYWLVSFIVGMTLLYMGGFWEPLL